MIRNYFKTAWRNIRGNKFYTGINVIGLALGLVISLFILLWVQDELSFNGFNNQAKNIYKVGIIGGTGPTKQVFSVVIAPVATYAKAELPEVKDAVRIMNIGGNTPFKYKDKVFTEDKVAFTDPSYFTIFGFNLISGDKRNPFPADQSVVISRSVAERYFGDEDPIGKVVILGHDEQMKVTGVIEDAPANSTVRYDLLLPISRFNKIAYVEGNVNYDGKTRLSSMDADWSNFSFETYLHLKDGVNLNQVTKKLQAIHERNKPEDKPVPYVTQSLLLTHLYKIGESGGAIETVKTFSIVAVMILVIACINYVNLSTARAMLRAREVSMRKIIGAGKLQLFIQFVVETALMFAIATIIAIGAMYVLLPLYNDFSGKHLTLSLTNYQIWLCIAATLLFTLMATSIYPAMLLSSFEPLKALKGKIAGSLGNVAFRRVLVVVQFSVSVVLIIGTLIIGNQLNFIRNKNLGYDKENVFSFSMRTDMQKHYEAVKAELLKQPGVLSVTRLGANIIDNQGWTGDNDWEGKPAASNLLFRPIQVDETSMPFFKFPMLEGKTFTGAVADSAHFIVNETAVKAMGLKDPIGKRMRLWKTNGTITGVVKDFHISSMHNKIEPVVFTYNPQACWRVYIKTTGVQAHKAVEAATQQWKQYNGQIPFNYSFLDEAFNNLYQKEQRTSALFNLFSAVAIVLSCLGLLGLATYTAQVKTREIGIRKVLGASVAGVVQLLTKEFMLLVGISLAIAIPIAWYAMNKWLADFAYRITIGWQVFALAGVMALLIAFITVSFQSIKAALANPVKSLRSE
ncbi:ABC transporter permease [Mucilaginibacter sp. UR6-1]|uniref:ABC transporter permease n=1 Tax=Mucilaginibacter sp. UR6-1 TaxID=1435643 RepID=UPI001E52F047|nr:ABC transporter permease [Mucilaginibacter sp. UR6-1]MCC8409378.1 ABC transporter permease [Mucilaginibacter sp. UR6-1]